MQITPSTLTFVPVPVGTTSAQELTADLLNNRLVSVLVTAIHASSTPAVSVFVHTDGTCPERPYSIGAFGARTLAFRLKPAQVGTSSTDLIIFGSGAFLLSLGGAECRKSRCSKAGSKRRCLRRASERQACSRVTRSTVASLLLGAVASAVRACFPDGMRRHGTAGAFPKSRGSYPRNLICADGLSGRKLFGSPMRRSDSSR